MKAIYREFTIGEELDTLIANATMPLLEIRLTEDELKRFCEETGYAFGKARGYTHKGYNVLYDWSSE